MLTVENLSVRISGKSILSNVSFSLEAGQCLMLCGPNGAGKSTLVKAISGTIPYEGSITLLGKDLQSCRQRQIAKHIGVLSQSVYLSDAFTVAQVVAMGRYAHRSGFLAPEPADTAQRVQEALDMVGLADLGNRAITSLSGGEQQRALLAQVLCQDPDVLILDEPANHLDLLYQKQLFDLMAQWRQRPGKAVIAVVHDLNLARYGGTHGLVLSDGQVVACGTVDQALQDDVLRQVWHMDVRQWLETLHDAWGGESAPNA